MENFHEHQWLVKIFVLNEVENGTTGYKKNLEKRGKTNRERTSVSPNNAQSATTCSGISEIREMKRECSLCERGEDQI